MQCTPIFFLLCLANYYLVVCEIHRTRDTIQILDHMKKLHYILLLSILVSCSGNSGNQALQPITEVFPLEDGNEWNYAFHTPEDTITGSASFSVSQLSDDSKRAVIELSSSMSEDFVFVLERKDDGFCIDNSSESYDEILTNINDYEIGECTVFLKYPVNDGEEYTFSNTANSRNYNYNVTVYEETITVNSVEYDVYNYVIPSGNEPELFATELFFNEEHGIVKLLPEAANRELILLDTNF